MNSVFKAGQKSVHIGAVFADEPAKLEKVY